VPILDSRANSDNSSHAILSLKRLLLIRASENLLRFKTSPQAIHRTRPHCYAVHGQRSCLGFLNVRLLTTMLES